MKRRYPGLGLATGIVFGALILGAALISAEDQAAGDPGFERIAAAAMLGCAASGLLGGLLWPYQRSNWETLLFSIPTAIPAHLGVGWAIGLTVVESLLTGIAVGGVYAAIYGGEHSRPKR